MANECEQSCTSIQSFGLPNFSKFRPVKIKYISQLAKYWLKPSKIDTVQVKDMCSF